MIQRYNAVTLSYTQRFMSNYFHIISILFDCSTVMYYETGFKMEFEKENLGFRTTETRSNIKRMKTTESL